ncbi:hypothetical protein FRB98_008515 [Tulasnella sp. 332]|nr:hypothetical protein FRB98_008515 [Tulasnella sp. 332]
MDGRDAIISEAISLLKSPNQDALLVGFQPGLVPSPEELISFFNALDGMTRLYLFTPSLSESGRGAVYTKFNAGMADTSSGPTANAIPNEIELEVAEQENASKVAVAFRGAADLVLSALAIPPQTSSSPPDPETSRSKKRKLRTGAHSVDDAEIVSTQKKVRKRKKTRESARGMDLGAIDVLAPQREAGEINVSHNGSAERAVIEPKKKKKKRQTLDESEGIGGAETAAAMAQPTFTDMNQLRGYSPSVPLPFSNIVTERIRALYGEFDPTVAALERFGNDTEPGGDEATTVLPRKRKKEKLFGSKVQDQVDDNRAEISTVKMVVPTGVMSRSPSVQAIELPTASPNVADSVVERDSQASENKQSKRSKRKSQKKVGKEKDDETGHQVVADGVADDAELVRQPHDPVRPDTILAPISETRPSEATILGAQKSKRKHASKLAEMEVYEGTEENGEHQAKKKRRKGRDEEHVDIDANTTPPGPSSSTMRSDNGNGTSQDLIQGMDTGAGVQTKVKKPKKKRDKDPAAFI